ncbi:pesticin C-terminus-like muramidase [Aeromonas sp. 604443]|uniref:pesticin C-terminus-like muramidase n=1 Tax=Aeromonas sp. 604443 TaxID=2712054 RepID=UPI003BA2CDB5
MIKMKIVYPMQLAGENGSSEIASLDEFIKKINGLKSGTFPIGRNRIWHGGIHFSKSGGWHPSGAVRAIADGEIVAYRLATKPAKATRSPEAGKPGDDIELHTSPSFCLVRHRYEGGEQNKNRLTFYSLYMHIACENSYNSPEAARVTVKGSGVSTYEPVAQGDPLKLTRRLSGSSPVYAKTGAEVKLLQQTPSNLLNHRDEAHNYFLVHYVDEPNSPFYIAQSQLQHEYPQKPTWMTPPEGKPARHKVPSNTWLRKTADTTVGSMGLPAGSEVVVSTEPPQMVNLNGGTTEFRKVQVFKTGSGTVKDSANQVMTNAGKGAVGWLAKSKMGAGLPAEPSTPVEFKDDAPVVNRSANPIPVQAGEIIGHWGEHELATASASGFEKDADSKAVHFEVFVSESDKQALKDCINNKARVTGGQGYLLVKKEVTTYRLTSDSQHGFHEVANFGPLVLPLAVKESDIVTHGANNFVKVRERTTADGELPGEFVLKGGDVEVISQHDWHQLGVKLVDGSSDEDGFLDKADTESEDPQQKEASKFFSTLYDKLVTDRDNNGTLSGNDIKAALADEELAGKLRMLFIKHKSEWVKPGDWPRLKQELADQPKLYEYAMQVHRNMAWVEDASAILGDTKPWFIHPAGMMGLVAEPISDDEMDEKWLTVPKGQLTFDAEGNDVDTSMYFSRHPHVPNNRGVVIGASGVTYGRGLDLGQISIGELNKLTTAISNNCKPLSSSMLHWLTGAVGLQRKAAYDYTIAINNVVPRNEQTLTRKQQHYLFNEIYLKLEAIAKRTIENPKGTRTRAAPNGIDLDPERMISWLALPQNIKDLLIDLTFRGDNRPSTREFFIPDLVESIKNNDEFSAFKENIKSNRWKETYNVPLDRHQRRCNYL